MSSYKITRKDAINNKIKLNNERNCNGNALHIKKQDPQILHIPKNVKPKKATNSKNKGNSFQITNETTPPKNNSVEDIVVLKPKKNKRKNKSNSSKQQEVHVIENAIDGNSSKNKKNSNASMQKRGTASNDHCTLVSEIAKAREHIKHSLEKMDGIASIGAGPNSAELIDRIAAVEKENVDLRNIIESLKNLVLDSQKRIATLEGSTNKFSTKPVESKKSEPEDDDGVDLFASDSEEESAEVARIREERLAAYAAKKSKKPALIAKSSVILDVKPWDDETDLSVMEAEIRKITSDGLLWGAAKLVPVAFGIKKLTINCVVEDEKISIDWLTEEIEKLEEYVQSVDVAAFNKI